jgi:hypothetical protein
MRPSGFFSWSHQNKKKHNIAYTYMVDWAAQREAAPLRSMMKKLHCWAAENFKSTFFKAVQWPPISSPVDLCNHIFSNKTNVVLTLYVP